jgi:ADP-ribosylglycohydrolase
MNINKDKCISIFLLHALGDTIGFKNGIWEFNYGNYNNDIRITIEIISEFISLGGITQIDLKDWNVSDDTLLNYEIAKFILNSKYEDKINESEIINLKNEIYKLIKKEIKSKIERGFGKMTIDAIYDWTDKKDQRHEAYNPYSGGNGCSMRTFPIGIKFYKDKDLNKLIEYSIMTSKLTHNSPIGFLGGLVTAYFVKLALNNIDIEKWPFLVIELLESNKVKSYIDIENDNIYFDYRNTIKFWKKYIEVFYSDDKKPLKLKTSVNIISRFKIFVEFNKILSEDVTIQTKTIGGNGQTSIMMAHNALLDCDGNWEKLVYYAMLHAGDSDTVGAIAGGLFGAVYGSKNIPEHLLKHLEMKKELIEMGENIYDLIK